MAMARFSAAARRGAQFARLDAGTWYAVLAALSFGAIAPLAKPFLAHTDGWLVAGLTHFGSGVGLVLVWLVRAARRTGPAHVPAIPLGRAELPAMLVSILISGVLGPALLMLGLAMTQASTTALLLNLEGLATMAIAWIAFRERFEGRLLVGALLVVLGSALLTWRGGLEGAGIDWGALPIIAACVAWGIGNNYTRQLIAADPVVVTAIKGLAAGAINIVLALAFGAVMPSLPAVLGMSVVGFVAYGLSFIFFILALRDKGTARIGAYLSLSPFFGAVVAIVAFDEPLTPRLLAASVLMAAGVWLYRARRPKEAAAGAV